MMGDLNTYCCKGRLVSELKTDPKLEKLLRDSVGKPVDREAQRKSWVIGELMLEHPEMTREEAERRYERAKL